MDFVDIDRFFKEGTEPEIDSEDFIKKWEEQEEMKKYIAIGEDGENKVFEGQAAVIAHFCIGKDKLYDVLERGRPVAEPGTLKVFYIDELEGDKK